VDDLQKILYDFMADIHRNPPNSRKLYIVKSDGSGLVEVDPAEFIKHATQPHKPDKEPDNA